LDPAPAMLLRFFDRLHRTRCGPRPCSRRRATLSPGLQSPAQLLRGLYDSAGASEECLVH
jgi:hypothetical protein